MSSTLERTSPTPEFRTLERDEIYALLARNHVGRMAYSRGPFMDIEPLHYVYSEGWIYCRTSRGTKLESTGDWWPVAFEVDEVDGLFDWRSVVVHGGFYTLSEDGSDWEREEREHGIAVLRTLIPETFTPDDPTPFRDVICRIAVQEVSGRAASSNGPPTEGARVFGEASELR
jgi:uncharacterized protein